MTDKSVHQDALVELREVSLVYRSQPALKDINWSLLRGQQWAVLGPNGAGKTSLARVITRQISRFSGDLLLAQSALDDGFAYVCFEQARALCERDKKLDDSEFRADANDPGTTVEALILNGREASERFHHWVQRLHMGHFLQRGLRYISTGEMRKALLVRAILSDTALIILDNPLDGLDRASQGEMKTILEELLHSRENILILCRQIEDIPEAVSHILVLNAGKVFTAGLADDILADKKVRTLMSPPLTELATLPPPAQRPCRDTRRRTAVCAARRDPALR